MTTSIGSAMAISLLILAACGENQQRAASTEVVRDVEVVRPIIQRPLVASDGTLLSPRDVVGAADALLILDRSADEIWEMPLDPPHELRRISRPRRFGQSRVFAFTSHSTGLSLLGVDGALRVMQLNTPDELARTIRAFAPMHRPIALGEARDHSWVAVHSLLVVQGPEAADSIIVSRIDSAGSVSRRYGFERSGPSRVGMFIVDRVSARTLGDRVVIVGNEPARVTIITDSLIATDTLLHSPVRELSDSERAGLRRAQSDRRAPAMLRDARTPTQRPSALEALPFDGGYLVVAQGGEFSVVADLYCGRSFRRTVLSRATLGDIFVTAHGLVAVDEPSDAASDSPSQLSYYRARDFIAECEK